jgi:uncharacterized protein with HEPN domain
VVLFSQKAGSFNTFATDMRDMAAHGYHTMDDDIIWNVATQFIPELLLFLESTLSKGK